MILLLRSTPRWVLFWTLLVLIITSLPHLAGLLTADDDQAFTGVLYNPFDTNSYYANMQLGAHGKRLYVLPYTAQGSTPVPAFTLYILLGHLARLTTLSIPLVFHLGRLLSGGAFALVARFRPGRS